MCLVAIGLPKTVVESRISFQGATEGQVGLEPNNNSIYCWVAFLQSIYRMSLEKFVEKTKDVFLNFFKGKVLM